MTVFTWFGILFPYSQDMRRALSTSDCGPRRDRASASASRFGRYLSRAAYCGYGARREQIPRSRVML